MIDRAPCRSADDGVVTEDMPGDATSGRAGHATSGGRDAGSDRQRGRKRRDRQDVHLFDRHLGHDQNTWLKR